MYRRTLIQKDIHPPCYNIDQALRHSHAARLAPLISCNLNLPHPLRYGIFKYRTEENNDERQIDIEFYIRTYIRRGWGEGWECLKIMTWGAATNLVTFTSVIIT